MESDTLTDLEGTISDVDADPTSPLAEESLAPVDVATDEGEQSEENDNPPGEADPYAALKALTPEQMRELPEIAAVLAEERRRAEQSANDRTKAQLAAQQAEQRRTQASVENRRVQASIAARVVKAAADEGRELTQAEIDSIFQTGEAHATALGVWNAAQIMDRWVKDAYPDFLPDSMDQTAMRLAINTGDVDAMGRITAAVIQKAVMAKRGIDEQQIRLDERTKVLAEREALGTQEAATKAAQKAAATRNDPAKQPTRVVAGNTPVNRDGEVFANREQPIAERRKAFERLHGIKAPF